MENRLNTRLSNLELLARLDSSVSVYGTIADLRTALDSTALGSVVEVLGHTIVGDRGGGPFICVELTYTGTRLYDDNGSVIFNSVLSEFLSGTHKAWVRILDRDPCCEMFGGAANAQDMENDDGILGFTSNKDNMFAINECMRVYGDCYLGTGWYGVDWCCTRQITGNNAGLLDYFPRNYLDFRTWNNGVTKRLHGPGRGKGGLCYLNRPRQAFVTPSVPFVPGTGEPSPEYREGFMELTGSQIGFSATANFACRAALCYMPGVGGHTNYHSDDAEVDGVAIYLNCANRWLLNRNPIDSIQNNTPGISDRRFHSGFIQMAPQAIWLQGSRIKLHDLDITGYSHGTQNVYEQVIVGVTTSRGIADPVIRKIKGPRITEVYIHDEHLNDYRKTEPIDGAEEYIYVARSGVYTQTADPEVFAYNSYLIPPQFLSYPELNGIVVAGPGGTQDEDTKYIEGTHIEACLIAGMSMIYSAPTYDDEGLWFASSTVLQSPHFKHGMTIYGGYGTTILNNVFQLIDGAAYYEDSSAPNNSMVFKDNVIDRCSQGVSLFGVLYAQNQMANAVFEHNTMLLDGDPTARLYPGEATTGRGYTETLAFQAWCFPVNFAYFVNIAFIGNTVKYDNLLAPNNYGARISVQYQQQIQKLVVSRNTMMVDDNHHVDFGCRTRNGIVFVAPESGTTYPGNTQLTHNYTDKGNTITPTVSSHITRATSITCQSAVWAGTGITATLEWDAVNFWLKITHPEYPTATRAVDWGTENTPQPSGQVSIPSIRADLSTATETFIQFRVNITEVLIEEPANDMDFRIVYTKEWGFQVSQQLTGLALTGDYPELDISHIDEVDLANMEPGIDYIRDGVNYRFIPYETEGGIQPFDVVGAGRLIHYSTPAIKAMVWYDGAEWQKTGNTISASFADNKLTILHLPVIENAVRNLTSNDELTARIAFDECTPTQTVIKWYLLGELQLVASTQMNVTVTIL